MIEQGIMAHLLADPNVTALVGTNVFYRRAPSTVDAPWVVVTNSGGNRRKLSMDTDAPGASTDARDTLSIYVDDPSQFRGRAIAEAVQISLENYRGDMLPAQDVHITTGTLRDLDGWGEFYRMLITVYARYRFPTNVPV